MGEDETGTLAALVSHRKDLIEPKEAQYHGRTIKLMGDGALMEFDSVIDAVHFAVEFQLAMRERNSDLPADKQIVYRIGINIGDIIVEGDDIFGDGVNVAARLEALADPGGICVRRNVHNQVRDKLDLDFEDLGEIKVKNIRRPLRTFRVVLNDKARTLVATIKQPPRRTGSKWRLMLSAAVAVAVSILVILSVMAWQYGGLDFNLFSSQKVLSLPDKPSIVVLPFANMGGESERGYFADGLTADLITDLSKISEIFVIARNSAFTYKGRAVKVQEVAEDLGVRYVLEGSVRQSGNSIRINAQLIDATTGYHLWSARYDRSQEDIFAVQDEVMNQIVLALEVQLTDREEQSLGRIPTNNLEAYDYYLRAERDAYSTDVSMVTQAIKRYKQATKLDQNFAQAHAGLARTFADVLLYDIGNVVIGPVARDAAYKAASRAAELDPDLARPLSVLGIVQMIDGEYTNAIDSARKAVTLAPNDAEAHINLALVLGAAGNLDDAVKEVESAFRLNPKPPPGFLMIAGLTYYLHRDNKKAVKHLEEARKTVPKSVMAVDFLMMAYAQMGRTEEARQLLDINLRKIDAAYSLSAAQVLYGHYKREEDLDHILDGLRKAGLPRWPFELDGKEQDRLNDLGIEGISRAQSWNGLFLKIEPFFLSFDRKGSFALRTKNTIRVGTSKILNGELCLTSPSQFLGRWSCGPVFRNPQGSSANKNDYVYGAGNWYFEFGLAE